MEGSENISGLGYHFFSGDKLFVKTSIAPSNGIINVYKFEGFNTIHDFIEVALREIDTFTLYGIEDYIDFKEACIKYLNDSKE